VPAEHSGQPGGAPDPAINSSADRLDGADRSALAGSVQSGDARDLIWTVPNALSMLRLLGVPVLIVLAVAGFTDWLDGVLARALHQTSRFGALLDPAADRLYILATLVGLVLRDIIPWWLAAILVGRDALLLLTVPGLRRVGLTSLPVNYLGKAATFALLYAFPLLLLGARTDRLGDIADPIAWAFTLWGTGMYLWAGVLYVQQYRTIMRSVAR
jgi:cardiolipin synthase